MSLPLTIEQTACCVPRVTATLTSDEAERAARVFKALGDSTRVMLLSLIAGSEGGEACICDLTEPVGLSQGTVSHHMKLLTEAGLVTREQRGKWAYFAVNDGALDAAADALRVR
ncbi:transcriptional regulator [Microbacterium bovistercoris]|uniref:Transcriptional regulator n=1 Tax=Microbacterium bovistercoris TaxID=2293570 RepID=A0A371NX61_9MICO|nr:metalloregulator ArsR/SmtB family transcription factor [Microbacterium bovistercoris]REJ07797.1 transcriptional regulator [Microbacterium bovistercoris]